MREVNGFYNNSIYYGDTDSLFIEKKSECVRSGKFIKQKIMSR